MVEKAYLELDTQNRKVFAIGDIHGCYRELNKLINYIFNKCKISEDDYIIFVGDYIDRGAKSKHVIDRLIELKSAHKNTIFLKGNHEDMLLDFLFGNGVHGNAYLENGGNEFFSSYNLNSNAKPSILAESLPKEHLVFFNNLERFVFTDNFVIVHAGLNPLRDITTQRDQDIFWIREEFLNNRHHFEKIIVFGHTVMKKVLNQLPYKIGIDTGLVYGGKLTCLELSELKVYQIKLGGFKVKTKKLK